MAWARRDEDRDREAAPAAVEQSHLVVAPARTRAPAALEVERPAAWALGRDAPTLRRYDRAEQAHRVAAVAPRDAAVDLEEEARLVRDVDGGEPPRTRGVEAPHVNAPGQTGEPGAAHDVAHLRGRGVVGTADHRPEQRALGGTQAAPAHLRPAQVGHEQHRLDHARRWHRAFDVDAAQPPFSADAERDLTGARLGVPAWFADVRPPRREGGVGRGSCA